MNRERAERRAKDYLLTVADTYQVEVYVDEKGWLYEATITGIDQIEKIRSCSPPDDPSHLVVLGTFEATTWEEAKRKGERRIERYTSLLQHGCCYLNKYVAFEQSGVTHIANEHGRPACGTRCDGNALEQVDAGPPYCCKCFRGYVDEYGNFLNRAGEAERGMQL